MLAADTSFEKVLATVRQQVMAIFTRPTPARATTSSVWTDASALSYHVQILAYAAYVTILNILRCMVGASL
jgi:hypothetical protein